MLLGSSFDLVEGVCVRPISSDNHDVFVILCEQEGHLNICAECIISRWLEDFDLVAFCGDVAKEYIFDVQDDPLPGQDPGRIDDTVFFTNLWDNILLAL